MRAHWLAIFSLLFIGLHRPAFAQEPADSSVDRWEDWNFNLSPYFWFVGIQGTIERPPYPTNLPEPEPSKEIDISFRELSNSLKFAIMLYGEYRNQHIVTAFHFTSIILEGEAVTPLDLIFQDVEGRWEHFSGDMMIAYRLSKKEKLNIDAGVGIKVIHESVSIAASLPIHGPIARARSVTWVDPLLTVRAKYVPHPKVEFVGYGDLGLLGTDYSYQGILSANYRFTPLFYLSVGYRVWGMEVPSSEAIFRGALTGAMARIGFRF